MGSETGDRERPFLFFGASHIDRLRTRSRHSRAARYWRAALQAARADLRLDLERSSWVDPSLVTGGAAYVEMAAAHDGCDRLVRLSLAYLVTGGRQYAEAAAQLADGGMRRKWSGYRMDDLVMAAWVRGLMAAQDWVYSSGSLGSDATPDSIASRIRTASIETAGWLAHDLLKGGHPMRLNHDMIEACTIGLVGLAYPAHKETTRWIDLAFHTVDGLLATCVGDDGDWYEKTPRYQCYLLQWLVPFADACRAAGLRDYYQQGTVRQLFQCILSWITPNGWNVGFNDATHDELSKMAPWLLAKAGSEYRDGTFLWALDRLREGAPDVPFPNHYVFLHFDPSLAPAAVEPVPRPTMHLRRSGMVLFRTGWKRTDSLFALQCGPYESHDHMDKSTIELYYKGVPLVLDTACGRYPERGKYLPASMHNVVVVDGGYSLKYIDWVYGTEGFDFCPPFHGRIVDVLTGPEISVVRADHSRHARVSVAERMVLFAQPGYVIMFDELEDGTPHRYDSYIHARGKPRVNQPARRVTWRTPEGAELTLYVPVPASGGLLTGEHEFAIQSSAEMQIEYSEALWRRSNSTLSYAKVSSRGTSARFLQILVPRAPGESAVTVRRLSGTGAVEIRGSDFRDIWLSQRSNQRREMERLATDVRLAFVRFRGGVPVAWLIVRGHRLVWRGEPLVSSPIETTFLGGAM